MQTPNESQNSLIIEERITKVNGDFHIKKYAQGKFLGKGGFAKVYIFTNLETNKGLAGKVMPKVNFNRSRSRQKLMTEIRLHKSLSHPNIVKFEHVFEDHENVYILLELCQNQSVNELLKRRKKLTEFEVQCYLIQIVSALKYLHANRIIHRDLKLGNMFLTDKMQIKLGDFGLAAKLEFDGEKKRTVCGTPNYIAPEILDGNIGHSYEVDIWSVGVIIYTLIIGKPPFETTDIKLTYKKIKENEYSFPDNATISDNARDLIKRILVTQPEKRLTLDEILLHPFIDHSGPVPSLMPVSTMATAPTNSYMKQFNSSNNSQRIRISTEPDPIDSSDPTKPLKSFFINTARTNTTPKTPSGNNLQKIDFFKLTPKTTKNEILGSDRFSPSPLSTFANDLRSKTPNSLITPKVPPVKTFLLTENIEEDQEEHAVEKIEDVKSSARGGLELLLPKDIKKTSNDIDEVRVVKWHDYSSKYGLGYALSNGAIGVFFNDGVKLVSDSEETFELIKRDSNKQDFQETHSFQDHPQEVHKRVLVFNHFKDNLKSSVQNPVKTNSFVYVKKWISTKHAVFFRMNNRVLQVNFKDESVLIMNSDAKRVVFVDTKGVKHVNGLEQASSSDNKDLAKRMKYTEDVLKQIWTVQTDNTTRKEKMTPRELGINEDLNKQAFNSQPERVI